MKNPERSNAPPAHKKLRDWLAQRQISHAQAAPLFGVSFRAFRGYLYGQRKPPTAFVVAVQEKTGILVGDWLPAKDGQP